MYIETPLAQLLATHLPRRMQEVTHNIIDSEFPGRWALYASTRYLVEMIEQVVNEAFDPNKAEALEFSGAMLTAEIGGCNDVETTPSVTTKLKKSSAEAKGVTTLYG
jgi:hypothetical protein